MLFVRTLLILSIGMSLGCKSLKERSDLKDFNKGRALNSNNKYLEELKKTHPKVVIIYIANDSFTQTYDHSRRNYDHLVRSLRDGINDIRSGQISPEKIGAKLSKEQAVQKLESLVNRLLAEDRRFIESINRDISALKKVACNDPGLRRDVSTVGGVAIFTNSMNEFSWGKDEPNTYHESRLRWQMCKVGQADATLKSTNAVYRPNFPFNVQPFSDPKNVKAAVKAARHAFESTANPGEKFRYVLVVKSHGSKNNVIVPMLSRDLLKEKVTKTDILKAVLGTADKKVAGLDGQKIENPILSEVPAVTAIDSLVRQSKPSSNQGVGNDIGYSKLSFLNDFSTLPEFRDMQFPLVIWYSCQSALEYSQGTNESEQWMINNIVENSEGNNPEKKVVNSYSLFNSRNIGLLYTTDSKGVKYDELDFQQIRENAKLEFMPDIQDALKAYMDSIGNR